MKVGLGNSFLLIKKKVVHESSSRHCSHPYLQLYSPQRPRVHTRDIRTPHTAQAAVPITFFIAPLLHLLVNDRVYSFRSLLSSRSRSAGTSSSFQLSASPLFPHTQAHWYDWAALMSRFWPPSRHPRRRSTPRATHSRPRR